MGARTQAASRPLPGRYSIAAVLAGIGFFLLLSAGSLQAQTYTVLHNFTGGVDGTKPESGVVLDRNGNLYGTTSGGVSGGGCNPPYCGGVYKLTRHASAWILNPLYIFQGGSDGAYPSNNLFIAPDGTLYGSTFFGGGYECVFGGGCGTIFQLRPSQSVCRAVQCPWIENVLIRFDTGDGGRHPSSPLLRDAGGNLYGTNINGGAGNPYGCVGYDGGCGVLFQLTNSQGGWTENVLYAFTGGNDGGTPGGSIVRGQDSDIYGSSNEGGNYVGVVYQLTPSNHLTVLSSLPVQMGGYAYGLATDSSGNLFGGAQAQGPNGGGSVYEVNPGLDGWQISLVYALSGPCCNPNGPRDLAIDEAGNIYGTTTYEGAYGYGSIFKLTSSDSGWTYSDLYDFTGGSDGRWPNSPLALDSNGVLYGTTQAGGDTGHGVIFQVTP